jgi:hypothetical protein
LRFAKRPPEGRCRKGGVGGASRGDSVYINDKSDITEEVKQHYESWYFIVGLGTNDDIFAESDQMVPKRVQELAFCSQKSKI